MSVTKNCFLCCVQIDETNFNSKLSSLNTTKLYFILNHILELPNTENYLEHFKFHSISYCKPCSCKVIKVRDVLEELEKLEKILLEQKYEIELKFRETCSNILTKEISPVLDRIKNDIVMDLRSSTILSMLEKIQTGTVGRKSKPRNSIRIMKDISISKATEVLTSKQISVLNKLQPTDIHYSQSQSHFHSTESPVPNFYEEISDPLTSDILRHTDVDVQIVEDIHAYQDFEHESTHSNLTNPLDLLENNILLDDIVVKDENLIPIVNIPTYVEEMNLTLEQNTFDNEPTFMCGKCEVTFDDYNSLNEHDKLHSIMSMPQSKQKNEIPKNKKRNTSVDSNNIISISSLRHECPECHKTFIREDTLRSHVKHLHRNEFKFRCSICHLGCRTLADLKIHTDTHSDVRNYKCQICLKRFKQKHNLTAHIRLHTGENRFQCNLCPAKFWYIKDLRRHSLRHIGRGKILIE